MYRLEHPIYFYLLAIIPIAWILYFGYLWWQKKAQKRFADSDLLEKLTPEKSSFKNTLKMILWSLAIALLIIGLVNPKIGTELKTVRRSGVDVVFALDVSRSMLAEDVAPSRLAKAKFIINSIINKLGSDRVGIIIYAGNAHILLPITTDHSAAKMFLETAHPDMLSSQGTALGEALKLAQNFYDSDADTNKYLFVVSDGEDHEENARDITKNLKELGVKVYALGLGTTQGGPIPINKIGGVQYKKDAEGNMVITQAHPEALKEIANIGKGKFWNGNHTKESIDAVTDMINEADKKEFESKEFSDYKDQFQWFIGLGLLLLLLDVLILEKKTAWLQKLNLFNEKVPKS